MKRVLVAGATGYLGGFVAREVKRRGHFVRALARSPKKLERLHGSLDEIVEAKVTRPETIEHTCEGIDAVFSSIGITRQRDGLTFRDVGDRHYGDKRCHRPCDRLPLSWGVLSRTGRGVSRHMTTTGAERLRPPQLTVRVRAAHLFSRVIQC